MAFPLSPATAYFTHLSATDRNLIFYVPSDIPPGPPFQYQPVPTLVSGTCQARGLGPDPEINLGYIAGI